MKVPTNSSEKRRDSDAYPTHPAAVRAWWLWLAVNYPSLYRAGRWHDPFAGEGAFIRHPLSPALDRWSAADIRDNPVGCLHRDLKMDEDKAVVSDSLQVGIPAEAHVITNVPYSRDVQSDAVALLHNHAREHGRLTATLTRLQWIHDGGGERWLRWRPDRIVVCGWRLQWKLSGPTEAAPHAYLVWDRVPAQTCTVEMLPEPSCSTREIGAWRAEVERVAYEEQLEDSPVNMVFGDE